MTVPKRPIVIFHLVKKVIVLGVFLPKSIIHFTMFSKVHLWCWTSGFWKCNESLEAFLQYCTVPLFSVTSHSLSIYVYIWFLHSNLLTIKGLFWHEHLEGSGESKEGDHQVWRIGSSSVSKKCFSIGWNISQVKPSAPLWAKFYFWVLVRWCQLSLGNITTRSGGNIIMKHF